MNTNSLRLVPEVRPGTSVASSVDIHTLPVLPALAELFPAGGLRRGASYVVDGSPALALALLAGPSAAGSWCAAVGVPTLGVEAAAELGVDLDRFALIPSPGRRWLQVVAALVGGFDVVLVRPPSQVRDADARRLAARCRERGAALVTLGPWQGAEQHLAVTASRWVGLGHGYGRLAGRQVTVTASRRSGGRSRAVRLWLPSPEGDVRVVPPEPIALRRVS